LQESNHQDIRRRLQRKLRRSAGGEPRKRHGRLRRSNRRDLYPSAPASESASSPTRSIQSYLSAIYYGLQVRACRSSAAWVAAAAAAAAVALAAAPVAAALPAAAPVAAAV